MVAADSIEAERNLAIVFLEVCHGCLDATQANVLAMATAVALDRRGWIGDHLFEKRFPTALLTRRQVPIHHRCHLLLVRSDDPVPE